MKQPIILLTALALGACAGRAPAPVSVVQPYDGQMTCTAIQAESQANSQKIAALGSEEGGKLAQNVAAGVVGLFFFPAWFLMDVQGSASKEVAALQARQQYLAVIGGQRQCIGSSSTTWQVQGVAVEQNAPAVIGRDDFKKAN